MSDPVAKASETLNGNYNNNSNSVNTILNLEGKNLVNDSKSVEPSNANHKQNDLSSPSVGLFFGANVDDSAFPPTNERNRLVTDLILHYSCTPFIAVEGSNVDEKQKTERLSDPAPGEHGTTCDKEEYSLPLFTEDLYNYQTIWSTYKEAPKSEIFYWHNQPFAAIGLDECTEFHDAHYVKYLSIRETLSAVDERTEEELSVRREASPKDGKSLSHSSLRNTAHIDLENEWTTPLLGRQGENNNNSNNKNTKSESSSINASAYNSPSSKPFVTSPLQFSDSTYSNPHKSQSGSLNNGITSVNVKRLRVESARPPSYARAGPGSSFTTPHRSQHTLSRTAESSSVSNPLHVAAAPIVPPPPPRTLPDLIPIEADEDYGLSSNDAVPFLGMWRSISSTVSGTLTALRWLLSETANGSCGTGAAERFAAVHWFGGRHHAKRDSGGGFCFINDVVLAALYWKKHLERQINPGSTPSSPSRGEQAPNNNNNNNQKNVKRRKNLLIIDLDAHHGDGTESAFLYDNTVYTISAHCYDRGVYPSLSGPASETGRGLARGRNMNLTLPVGCTDSIFVPLVRQGIRTAVQHLNGESGGPNTIAGIILVCGADGLQGDPLGDMNLSIGGLQSVVRLVLDLCADLSIPLLILGAGGYVDTSTARLAAAVTRDLLSCAAMRQYQRRQEQKGEKETTAAGTTTPPPSGSAERYGYSPLLENYTGVQVPEGTSYFTRYGPSFLMHTLPPEQQPKCSQLLPEHPYYLAWERIQQRQREILQRRSPAKAKTTDKSETTTTTPEKEEEGSPDKLLAPELQKDAEESLVTLVMESAKASRRGGFPSLQS